jgi:di/tricarboxylate transporter
VTLDQGLAFAIVAVMMALFVWGRIRYDLVAMLGLLAAIAVGIVPFDQAFTGFSDDIVIIVGSALLVSAAVARSGVAERLIAPLAPYLTTTRAQVVVLTGAVALLSAFVKNVGALAIFMPIAFQLGLWRSFGADRRSFRRPGRGARAADRPCRARTSAA